MKAKLITSSELQKEYERLKASDTMPKKIVDPSAETVEELKEHWVGGDGKLRKFVRDKVASGEWERVWKNTGMRLVPAYRVKRK